MISVVIATYNGEATLRELLQALEAQPTLDAFEVVVSDNGSTDETIAIAYEFQARISRLVVVDSSDLRGVSHARNVGAAAASGDFLLFCDQDDIVGDGWLAAMSTALQSHAFVAARLERRRLNPAWTLEVYGESQRDGLVVTEPPFLPYALGTSLGISRDLHLALGGFDETFREGGEDNDYCYRVQLAGTPLHFVETAVVHFRHRQQLGDIFHQWRGYGREYAALVDKYVPLGMAAPSQARALASWILLFPRLLPSVWSQAARARWVARFGWRLGRAQGSFRNRTLAF